MIFQDQLPPVALLSFPKKLIIVYGKDKSQQNHQAISSSIDFARP
jgi:hypothetical protein